MTWTVFDIALLALVSLGLMMGLLHGLVRIALSWLFFLGAFVLAFFFYHIPGAIFENWTGKPLLSSILGWLLIFTLVHITGSLLSLAIARWLSLVKLRWMDRLYGGILGMMMGLFLGLVAVFFIACYPPLQGEWFSKSKTAPYLVTASQWMVHTMPSVLKKARESYGKTLETFKALPDSDKKMTPQPAVPEQDQEKDNPPPKPQTKSGAFHA